MGNPPRTETGIDFVEAFATAAEWFAGHLGRTASRSPVPSCAPWSVLDLAVHLGNVHSRAATVVETGRSAQLTEDRPPSHRPKRLADWYVGRAEDLYAVLRDTPEDKPCWNFAFGLGTAGFWHRRQAHETLMHGVDLALAAGIPERLPVDLATDGIDETLTVFLYRMHRSGHPADLVRPLCLSVVDAGMSWTLEPVPTRAIPAQPSAAEGRADRPAPRVLRTYRPGVDLVEAPAGVLLKLLWKRIPMTHPEMRIFGDTDRIGRFLGSRLTP